VRASAGLTFVWARAAVKAKRNVITLAMIFSVAIVMPMSPSLLCASLACAWQLYQLKRLSALQNWTAVRTHFAPEDFVAKNEFEVAARIRTT
jgi:hypothetical protein